MAEIPLIVGDGHKLSRFESEGRKPLLWSTDFYTLTEVTFVTTCLGQKSCDRVTVPIHIR
jgi:hypothetical protein